MRDSQRGVVVDAARPVIEKLEDRRMLSASLSNSGLLKVVGTAGDDTITINLNTAKTKITVNDGTATKSFTRTAVKTISVLSGDGADTITVGSGIKQQITIKSGEGNDTVNGGSGREIVFAGGGDDSINGGGGSDQVFGGDGNDTIDGGSSADYLYGDLDDDVITGGSGNDVLAGDSEDTLVFSGQPPFDIIGNDNLNGGDGNDWLLGGTRVAFGGSTPFFTDNGQDTFTGGPGNDIIDKGGNDDTVTDEDADGFDDFIPVEDQARVQEGGPGDVHTHVIIKVKVRKGSSYKNVLVMPDIGFFGPNGAGDLSNLHTHDASGLIHYEAAAGSPSYSLLEFFRVWGISMDKNHVGRFIPPPGKKVTMVVTRGGKSSLVSGKYVTTGGTTFTSTKFGGFVPVGDNRTGAGGSGNEFMTGDVVEIRVG
jgi:Ca2+-binding RTX toxin-like protein